MFQELLAGPTGPIVIFFLRMTDVSMATVRMLLMVRGRRMLVPLIGFVEILIWVVAIGTVVQHLDSPLHVVGYAAGFACGNLMGILLEERMALGLATVRTMVKDGGAELADALRDHGFGVTELLGQGRDGPVEVLYSVLPRKAVPECVGLINGASPESFVVVDEPRSVLRGWRYPQKKR